MSAIALLGPVRMPTIYSRNNALAGADAAMVAFHVQKLPIDPAGMFALTLKNVIPGSAIQISTASGDSLLNDVSATSTFFTLLSAYVGGSPLNDLRIKVRKGSASPFYQPWETQVEAAPGAQSIFVSQIPDE